MSRPTIALCLIAKNEEENLPRLFKSIEGCFDEIHLTDTGSTDKTVEVARRLGATVHDFKWCDDFSAARNASFEPAQSDYVMWLDCDDVLENKEAFLLFRDEVMKLNDYWMATYHYTSDASGKPVCSFVRERILRRSKNMTWKYFVHEGVTPQSEVGEVKVGYIPTWAVRHMRTEADLKKDRSRNLTLFERNKDKMDARMRYYYGKELFEAQKPFEAAKVLIDAVADELLDPHDRILGLQYAIYSFMQLNQFEMAIKYAQQGMMIAPHRAEFYTLLADCFIKLGKPFDSIPLYAAAKNCLAPQSNLTPRALFHQEDAYTHYPRNQLARMYATLGDMEKARSEAAESYAKYAHPESKALLDEIDKILKGTNGYKDAVECDDIVISSPPMNAYEWDPGIAKTKAMGGSETAAIEMAYWLHKLSGRPVKVFNMRSEDKTFDGVEYIDNKKTCEYFSKHKPWLHIAWRHNMKLTDAPTFLWCHDLMTPGAENHVNYIKHLCLTPFHKKYAQVMQGVPADKIHVTRNGIKPERFKGPRPTKDPFRFVFGSSPDRGLERAMRVLDRVREKYPQVTLHVHYGIEHLHKYGLQHLADKLKAMMDERPWVKYHGSTQQDELMRSYQASAYNVQPSDWIETSCISAMELILCGVYPIFRKVGGVADTLAEAERNGMATLVDSDCITEREHDLYAEKVIEAMDSEAYKRVQADPETFSWKSVAEEWLRDLPKLMGAHDRAA